MDPEDVEEFKRVEEDVNRHLYLITAVITVIAMALILVRFSTGGAFLSSGISFFYVGVVLIYSLHKEMIRWRPILKL